MMSARERDCLFSLFNPSVLDVCYTLYQHSPPTNQPPTKTPQGTLPHHTCIEPQCGEWINFFVAQFGRYPAYVKTRHELLYYETSRRVSLHSSMLCLHGSRVSLYSSRVSLKGFRVNPKAPEPGEPHWLQGELLSLYDETLFHQVPPRLQRASTALW
jgi:hypothetical protein